MKCINCGMEIEVYEERDDNPYAYTESLECDCWYSYKSPQHTTENEDIVSDENGIELSR